MIVVTAAGSRSGTAVVRSLRALRAQGRLPSAWGLEHGGRLMFDHYRAHGFTGSPRVLTALLGRRPRSVAEHLADLPVPRTRAAWR